MRVGEKVRERESFALNGFDVADEFCFRLSDFKIDTFVED